MDFMKNLINALHHFFIPRSTNNFNAKLLHHDLLTIYLVAAMLLTVGFKHAQKTGDILGYATDVTVEKLLVLTNAERAKENLSTLQYNENLAEAAKLKAENMFAQNYWSHYGPDGETPWQFILESGYQYEYAGENLAKNFLFSDGIVQAWMDSPTHRENIMRGEYSDVGFAVVNGVLNGEETTLVVQMFGKPLYGKTLEINEPVPQGNQALVEEKIAEAEQKQQVKTNAEVLAKDSQNPVSSFFPVYFNLNMIFFAILLLALFLDFYFASKLNLIRVKGKNLIHIMFIGFIVIGAFIIIKGTII